MSFIIPAIWMLSGAAMPILYDNVKYYLSSEEIPQAPVLQKLEPINKTIKISKMPTQEKNISEEEILTIRRNLKPVVIQSKPVDEDQRIITQDTLIESRSRLRKVKTDSI